MKKIRFKENCTVKGKKYIVGDEFKPKKEDMLLLCRLNEKGFIEPLTKEELLEISNSFNLAKLNKIGTKKKGSK